MARFVLCLLAVFATAFATSNEVEKVDAVVLAERQLQILDLLESISEPTTSTIIQSAASNFKGIEENLSKYGNETAAKLYAGMLKNKWYVPRSVPFSVNEPSHAIEALNLFNVLYTAKDFDTFYNTASYLRDIINEGIFVYTVSIAILYRRDTEYVVLPPIYESFPSLFNDAEIIATAERINVHGQRHVKYYQSTYISGENVIIKANSTISGSGVLSYFTDDYDLSAAQYFFSLVTPFWLGNKLVPNLIYKEIRGEAWWFAYRQLVAQYYMNRLSNGLGEIPEITDVYEEGYTPGLVYSNGVPLPSRPDNFRLDQPQLASVVEEAKEFERRIWEAIDKGFYVNRKGNYVSLLNDGGLDVLARLIESNADSPNAYYYKDFIRLWKKILGNTIKPAYKYDNNFSPLAVPSALESYKTSLRDPAFYSLLKRVLNLFVYWQKQMPLYTPEELTLENVEIEKIETDKLVTFFEYDLLNITSSLYQKEHEAKEFTKDVKVLVEHQRLNHKPFSVKLSVKSDSVKKVVVKLFLAPKYDSKGFEIPLQKNTENFFLLDQFFSELKAGENVITRSCDEYLYVTKKVPTTYDIAQEIESGNWSPKGKSKEIYPYNLLLPKGTVGGQTFQLIAYIYQFDGYKQPYTPGYRGHAFPADRPLYTFQVKNVKNLKFQDVKIYHEE